MAAQASVTCGDGKEWVDSVLGLYSKEWTVGPALSGGKQVEISQHRALTPELGPQKGEGKIGSEREEAATAKGEIAFITVKTGIVFKAKKPVQR